MDKHPVAVYGLRNARSSTIKSVLALILLIVATITAFGVTLDWHQSNRSHVPINATQIVQKCHSLNVLPAPPSNFHARTQSDRFVPGTPPTLFKNATIWTGRVDGHEVIRGDLLLDKGLIKEVGGVEKRVLNSYKNLVVIDAGGAWLTPGIVDMHSHIGVGSAPSLRGANDGNSHKGLILPWMRSLDGLNTHDDAYQLSISGGVTTANVLPGSANAIGGQAFTIKLRPTAERSSSSMVLELPHSLNGTDFDPSLPPRWRQMKHACGENPSRVYQGTRMDTIWAFRQGYDTARKLKNKQDAFCRSALAGKWEGLGQYPEDLQWEALVDVLRGRVKVHNHCYEAVDLDGMVRLTNEFKFSIAAFHHAHETYLVPDLLKKAYGKPPAIAMFATSARYKREAYRGSEFAPRILADNGLQVVMKSDHPVLNSRYLLFEAQQAHYYGLPRNLALASVISTPAKVLGYDHRIGFIKPGYDADIVLWDSHPLALGATPKQVFIDGIAQLDAPHTNQKPSSSQRAPKTPNFDKEAKDAVKYDGLPPLETNKSHADIVLFTNVHNLYLRRGGKIQEAFSVSEEVVAGVVVVENGEVKCYGSELQCPLDKYSSSSLKKVDLEGGSISPALISYGSPLGLVHIAGELSAQDGPVFDPLSSNLPAVLGEGSVIQAVDGLQFASRDALLAYRSGVTVGITAPSSGGFLSGLGTAFSTGSPHGLAEGAIVQEQTSLHFEIGSSIPSVSTQISALRTLFFDHVKGELGHKIKKVITGDLPLVIQVQSADIMVTLLNLKKEIDAEYDTDIQLTFAGANEAHLLAQEIGEAGVGVILTPSRPYPSTWKSRRIMPGPPLTPNSAISTLLSQNVTLGIGIEENWSSRGLRFDVAWAALEAQDEISRTDALALASVNLERLLGIRSPITDLVAVKGGSLLDFEGKVVALISPRKGSVEFLV